MAIIYTIQNSIGDEGWIQYIDTKTKIVTDDIMGGSYKWEEIMEESFLIITKKEYDIITSFYDLLNETGLEEYIDLISKTIHITIENNIANPITKNHFN
jgi:UDP-N-acetylglucosamine enolpyruvyl transferase